MNRIAFASVSLILLVLTFFLFTPIHTEGDLGMLFASPNQWQIPRFLGWLLNTIVIFLSASVISLANKKYNFISEPEPIMTLALLLLLGCNCLTTFTLSTSTLLFLVNVLSIFVILSTYEEPNASKEFFAIGTLPAIGAMFQYSFLWMIPVYIGGGLLMKSFRLRELIAFIFGLLAPYWILFGLRIMPPDALRMPEFLIVFSRDAIDNEIFFTILYTGLMALLAIIFSLYNSVRLFSRNSRLRCMHLTFNLMGYVAVMAIIFDFNNFTSYIATLALWLAIEFAALLHLYNLRNVTLALILMLAAFLPLYILAL